MAESCFARRPPQKGHFAENGWATFLPPPMRSMFEIPVAPAPRAPGGRPAEALYAQLRDAIRDGRVAREARLPPTREAKALFGVSRNTLAAVYERLVSEGYAAARHGSGTYVCWAPPARRARDAAPAPAARLNPFWSTDAAAAMNFWRDDGSAPVAIDLRPGLVDLAQFPFDVFRSVAARQLRRMERVSPGSRSPQGNRGNFHLRQAITAHAALMRGVACAPDEVLVTSGAQQAFDLAARVLVRPGETVVAVEDPGYPPLRVPFAAAGAKLVPVPVDAEGLVVDALPRDAAVICLCPSHQFPLGVTLSPRRREQLLAFARTHGATIVEDDYDGEFRHDGSPIAPLRTPASADLVMYVGTFSKCMFPSLRLGYLVAPPWASAALVAAKNSTDWHCPTPMQAMVAEFIAAGHLRRHVRAMRAHYQRRQRFVVETLAREFHGRLAPLESRYGMHACAAAAPDVDVEGAARRLQHDGIHLHTLERYHLGREHVRGLVVGYGSTPVPQLRKALAALHAALRA
jgi:GntR family transcriptional regulator/MocR family aminotransferase